MVPATKTTHARERTETSQFRRDVLHGLTQHPKRLPCKYFYDRRGSQLFDQICELDEYYLTRTELSIMREHAGEMAGWIGTDAMVVEFGSGSSTKSRLLLDRLDESTVYVPVDISREHLLASAANIAADYPHLEVRPLVADFTKPIMPPDGDTASLRRVVYFPGSTIGNFEPQEARRLLRHIRDLVGAGGGLLIGFDLHKSREILEAAYNDSRGITAAFNLNLLHRMNRELRADFVVERFRHRAIYNELLCRIEMHLVSTADQAVLIGSTGIEFDRGESICTEYSHKYRVPAFRAMLAHAGFMCRQVWTDSRAFMAVAYFESA
ncbi:MAG: L-histidine N(alpha)-methyltransferase [Planctomycetales bacterium]|nr:L-histidine N(alpha)-methyltransferase [Planctomycetales bacterium]MCA9227716.1 L-histidine N(alpha)-methyltransferase [Planctomycetales bacterium]